MNKSIVNDIHCRKYWFFIEPYVYISLKKDAVLFYDSLSGQALEYRRETEGNHSLLNLVKKLQSPKHLRVIQLSGKDLADPVVSQWVKEIRQYFMGDLIEISCSEGKPVLMASQAIVGKDIKKLKKDAQRSIGEELIGHMAEIFLYLNNACEQNCSACGTGYKQFPCCTAAKHRKEELDLSEIQDFLNELKGSSLVNINILGGNIFKYSQFIDLSWALNHFPAKKIYYCHYLNLTTGEDKFKLLNPCKSALKILVTFPLELEKLKLTLDFLKKMYLAYELIFIIQDAKEFGQGEAAISSLGISVYRYQPWYNGENLDFFIENVFMTCEEIIKSKPLLKDIYTNSLVNKLDFGRITVLPNGHIYANANTRGLGILGKDSLYDVLYKELNNGKSWFRIRKHVEPCRQCTLEALCPPLNNYTYAIGRNNLCRVNV